MPWGMEGVVANRLSHRAAYRTRALQAQGPEASMKWFPRVILVAVCLLALFNFAAFWIASDLLGGDALNGKVENGHYFLAEHGRLTEVRAGVFTYSLWHARSLFVTNPLAMLTCWLASRRGRKRPVSI